MSDNISEIQAIEILDSRGNPTVGVRVRTEGGAHGLAYVPSGASTGAREAREVRDQDPARFLGRGVRKATGAVNTVLREALLGMPVQDQRGIDDAMLGLDGTPDKSNLGANALLGVSLACARAGAASRQRPLFEYLRELQGAAARPLATPMPLANILNGGAHADNPLDIQECMVMPIAADRCSTAVRQCAEVFQHLKRVLAERGLSTLVGDEGGFAPAVGGVDETLGFLMDAIATAGLEPGKDVALALDCASTEFHSDGRYKLEGCGLDLDAAGMVDWLAELVDRFPIASIEDGMAEDDIEGWKLLNDRLGERVQLVGDDLLVSQVQTLERAEQEGWLPNAVLVKPNQVGTLSETLETIAFAAERGMGVVVSHRSGDTEDSFIADLATATGAGQIKLGAPSRTDRTAKYNRMLWIEHDGNMPFAGNRQMRGAMGALQGP